MTEEKGKKKYILPVSKSGSQKRVTIPKEIKTDYVEVQEHE